jgi:predicted RNase H-like nuclease (RuvC/YqgF family)
MGLTVGIAILDTKGNLLDLTSRREATKSFVIKHISKFGKPVVLASDVNPPPKAIEKIASSLGSKVFYPRSSMSNAEKKRLVGDFEDEIGNAHEKDALAAGLRAFRNYHGLLLKIEEVLESMGHKELFDEVVVSMLRRRNENIVDVTKKILADIDEKKND